MRQRYVLHEVSIDDLADPILISNRAYRPDAGPHSGIPFRASLTADSYNRWVMSKPGMVRIDDVLSTVGPTAFKPFEITVINGKPTRNATDRELDSIFSLREWVGTVKTWIGSSKVDGTPPAWADLTQIFSGRIDTRPTRDDVSRTVTFLAKPTQSELDRPQLKQRFTGYGGYFSWDNSIDSAVAPSFLGGDFTFQLHGTIYVDPLLTPSANAQRLYVVQSAVPETLMRVYIDVSDYHFYMQMRTAAGTDTYDLGAVDSTEITAPEVGSDGTRYMKLFNVIVSWKESNLTVTAWLDGTQTLNTAMSNVSNGGGLEDSFRLMVTSDSIPAYLSSVRIFDTALDTTTSLDILDLQGAIEYPQDDLVNGYEFDILEGEYIADYGSARIDLFTDHVSVGGNQEWGVITQNLDGAEVAVAKPIPAAFGDCFNVPVGIFSSRFGVGYIARYLADVWRVYVNGVKLGRRFLGFEEAYYAAVSARNNTIWLVPGTINPKDPVFGLEYVPDQQLNVTGGPISANGVFVLRVKPSPHRYIIPEGLTRSPLVLVFDDIPGVAATVQTDLNIESVYHAWYPEDVTTGVKLLIYTNEMPKNATADIVGDPTLIATSPPGSGYVPPGNIGNAVMQIVTRYNLAWTSSEIQTPAWSDFNGRIGYFVDDHATSVRDVLTAILRGECMWLDEGLTGVSVLRDVVLPTGSPVHTISEGSVISVKTVTTRAPERRSINAIDIRYRRSWAGNTNTDMPEYAEEDVAEFIRRGYQQFRVGPETAINNRPVFETFEVRRSKAKIIGEKVLDLSKGTTHEIRFRQDPEYALTNYTLGDEVGGSLPSFDLPSLNGIITDIGVTVAAGTVTLNVTEV